MHPSAALWRVPLDGYRNVVLCDDVIERETPARVVLVVAAFRSRVIVCVDRARGADLARWFDAEFDVVTAEGLAERLRDALARPERPKAARHSWCGRDVAEGTPAAVVLRAIEGSKRLHVDAVADALRWSEEKLRYTCHEEFGVPPGTLIELYRWFVVSELRDAGFTIGECAAAADFVDGPTLIRFYRNAGKRVPSRGWRSLAREPDEGTGRGNRTREPDEGTGRGNRTREPDRDGFVTSATADLGIGHFRAARRSVA